MICMQGKWIEVQVITKSEALEPVSGIFYSMDCQGVAIEDPRDILDREQGPLTWDFADINILEHKGAAAVVKGYFSADEKEEEIVKIIEEKLNNLKEMQLDVGEGKVISTVVKEEDWANNWKKYYKPTKIGNNMVVKPIWEDYTAEKDEIIIELDPGMAFGTGTHETTRMCIEAIEKYTHKDSVVYDIGTGSGILAIAASKLGAKEVWAVDLDPVAVDSARENVAHNNINNIHVVEGNLVEVVDGQGDIVVANIIAEIICVLVNDVKKVLKNSGVFITSGIINDRVDMVKDKLLEENFEVIEVINQGEWNCIVAKVK